MTIHGAKRVERRIGYVADFCPVCRTPQVFRLLRIGMASHIYFVSIGGAKLIGHVNECLTCGMRIATDPLWYKATEKKPLCDVEMMMQKTLPALRTVYAGRLELEENIKKDPHSLSKEQRAEFIAEAFRLLNPMIEARFENSTEFDKPSGIWCRATVVVPSLVIWVTYLFGKGGRGEQSDWGG